MAVAEPRADPGRRPAPPGGSVQSGVAAFTPDGRVLLGGTRQGELLTWRSTPQGMEFVGAVPGLPGNLTHLVGGPDSRLVAAMGSSGSITNLYTLDEHGGAELVASLDTESPQMASFNREGTLLAVALGSGRVRLFDPTDPAQPSLRTTIETAQGAPLSLAFAPTNDLLVVGFDNGTVVVWDTAPAGPVVVNTFLESSVSIYGVTFDPTGTQVAASASDQRIWGWSVGPEGSLRWSLASTVGRPWDVRWVGDTLLAAGDDGHVQTWVSDPDVALTMLCSSVGDQLQPLEWERHMPGVPVQDHC